MSRKKAERLESARIKFDYRESGTSFQGQLYFRESDAVFCQPDPILLTFFLQPACGKFNDRDGERVERMDTDSPRTCNADHYKAFIVVINET